MLTTVPTLLRHADWRQRLAALMAEHQQQPFAWGTHDCGSWGADVVLALTGRDALTGLRGSHTSAKEAQRELQRRGGLVAVLRAAGLQAVVAADTASGDLVVLAQGAWPVLGVCLGGQAWAPGVHGLAAAPMAHVLMAWRVGVADVRCGS